MNNRYNAYANGLDALSGSPKQPVFIVAPPPTDEGFKTVAETVARHVLRRVLDNKTEPGLCGGGIADLDSDSDGLADCKDEFADDQEKTVAGKCGCGQRSRTW